MVFLAVGAVDVTFDEFVVFRLAVYHNQTSFTVLHGISDISIQLLLENVKQSYHFDNEKSK